MPGKIPLNYPVVLGKDFDETIEFVRKSSIGTPKKLTIDLSVAHNDLPYDIAANFIYVIGSANDSDNFDIRFNETREPSFNVTRQVGFYTPFYRFYVTNTAQATGEVTLVYGTLARPFLDIIDNRSPISLSVESVRDELRGDLVPEGYGQVAISNVAATLIVAANANRKSVIIQNDIGNTGNLYLGFDNTVAANNKFATLTPGSFYAVDDYRGAIYGLQTVLNDPANYGEV